jgi:hypothetical protein
VLPLAGLLLALGAGSAFAQPSWYNSGSDSGVQPGSPDFYQHQINQFPEISNGGFCTWYAFEDAMYFDSTMGYGNLYQNNANWVNGMLLNFVNIYETPSASSPDFFTDFNNLFNAYIASNGYGGSLVSTATTSFGGANGVYDTIHSDLLGGSNVLIHLATNSNMNQWWTYHVMDVVGFSNNTIVVLDPDNNRYGGHGFPGSATNPPVSGFYTNGFGVGVPYNLVYYNTNEPFPLENGWGDVGNPTNSLLQTYTVDTNGVITSGVYAGTQIDGLWAIGPVPEPSVFAFGAASATVFTVWRLRRRTRRVG